LQVSRVVSAALQSGKQRAWVDLVSI
jgi:hypothetical protein